jgi:hypothetical protein
MCLISEGIVKYPINNIAAPNATAERTEAIAMMSAVASPELEDADDPGEVSVDDGATVVSDTDIVVLPLEKWLPADVASAEVDKNVDLSPVSYVPSIRQEGIC